MSLTALPGSPERKQESRNARKVLRLLEVKLTSLGFQRTKPTVFTRRGQYVVEFVHVHKFTFGPSFRVHFGVRVRTDDFPANHLNGPASDAIADPESPGRRLYRFEFTPNEVSWESCAEAMHQCVRTDGLRWFASVTDPVTLLSPGSPLTPNAKAALKRELEQPSSVQVSAATLRVLNAA